MKFTALPVTSLEDVTLDFEQIQSLLNPPAWAAPALENSWAVAFGLAVGYLKDALGFVHLRGAASGGASGTTAFTLPAGFRPGQQCEYVLRVPGSTTQGWADLSATGALTCYPPSAGVALAFDGITFLAER